MALEDAGERAAHRDHFHPWCAAMILPSRRTIAHLYRATGNPGLLDFYVPFLDAIHEATAKSSVAILAHAHLGLISHVGGDGARPMGRRRKYSG